MNAHCDPSVPSNIVHDGNIQPPEGPAQHIARELLSGHFAGSDLSPKQIAVEELNYEGERPLDVIHLKSVKVVFNMPEMPDNFMMNQGPRNCAGDLAQVTPWVMLVSIRGVLENSERKNPRV